MYCMIYLHSAYIYGPTKIEFLQTYSYMSHNVSWWPTVSCLNVCEQSPSHKIAAICIISVNFINQLLATSFTVKLKIKLFNISN